MNPILPLWPPDAPGIDIHAVEKWNEPEKFYNICNPTLTVFEPPPEKRNGTAVVICPGGGYEIVSCPNEGWPVARWLNDLGVCAYVLKYRVPGDVEHPEYRHPIPLTDAQRALRMVRSSADERGIRENHIGILGFSAGGHLAAHASTQFANPVQQDPVSCRPAFSILIYPVINFTNPAVYHGGSKNNLLGEDASDELKATHSPDLCVTPQTPPAFLAHARDDDAVPYVNSQLYFDALKKDGVDASLHLYETGGHGFGMGSEPDDSAQWPAACAAWLKDTGWI